jgi:hypothetical protein
MADINDLVTTARNILNAINNLNQTLTNVFPQQGGTSSSATGGAATLPANPVGFLNVTLPDGTAAKVPYYS